jgi:hypothetical protein
MNDIAAKSGDEATGSGDDDANEEFCVRGRHGDFIEMGWDSAFPWVLFSLFPLAVG